MNRGCADLRRTRMISRRECLRIGGLGLMGTTLPHLLEGRALASEISHATPTGLPGFGKAKRCIFLFMWGGPAQQDTWDMKPDAPEEYRGEFRPIDTNVPGIRICEHFERMAQRADKLAILRSLTHGDVNHTTATHELLTGQPYRRGASERETAPHLGSVLAHLGRKGSLLPPAVNLMPIHPTSDAPRFVEQSQGQGAGWLGPIYDPMLLTQDPNADDFRFGYFRLAEGTSPDRLLDRRRLLATIDRQSADLERRLECQAMGAHYERAYELLTSPGALRAFRLDEEPDAVRERYGRHPHGQATLLARRLIEADVPMVTVFWQNDGTKNVSVYWDTHNRNFVDLRERLIPASDQAFSALLDDLEERGLLDETLIVWSGEFGRTPRVGQSVVGGAGAGKDGRDHWSRVFSAILAGAGVRGGSVYGSSDRYAATPASKPTPPADLVATLYHLLGVHPHAMLRDRLDRPTPICRGSVLSDVLA